MGSSALANQEIYENRSKFINDLRTVESKYEEKLEIRAKDILLKVKNEYKPLIQDYQSKGFK